ncbi:MAG: polysaccharide deacetylase family protein [Pseudomonadota bacterium]
MRWPHRRLSILMYHRVLARHDPLQPDLPDVHQFERHMRLLARCFHVLPLHEAAWRLREGTLPPRAACLTFDDGYADNVELALPVLRRQGLSACFFISTGYLGGGRMWNDSVIAHVRHAPGPLLDLHHLGLGRHAVHDWPHKIAVLEHLLQRLKYLPQGERQAIADQLAPPVAPGLMMTPAQLQLLHRAGMEVGAHTVRHPILATLEAPAARHEIGAGKAALEQLIDASVRCFAYPNGRPGQDYDRRHVRMVAELGFEAAVSTQAAAAHHGSDPLQLPRFTPWEAAPWRFGLRLLHSRWRRPA